MSKEKVGGTVYYASKALQKIGIDVTAFARLSKSDSTFLKNIGFKMIPLWSRTTSVFKNIYDGNWDRKQEVESVIEPFLAAHIENIEDFDCIHLGPLNNTDMPLAFVKQIGKSPLISADLQGWLRKIKDKKIVLSEWKEKEKFLKHFDIVKCDVQEALVLSGMQSIEDAAGHIFELGPSEVLITDASRGSYIYTGILRKIKPYKPKTIVDVTGAGDTYTAGYISKRLDSYKPEEAANFASHLATKKIEGSL